MNTTSPALPELAADNLYVTTADWQAYLTAIPATTDECLNYVWDKDATSRASWIPYQESIYFSNVVLDILPTIAITSDNSKLWNTLKGEALFFRAFGFFQIAELYCRPYSQTASSDLGIPLRLTSDINERTTRSTVQQTYDQILSDLKEAAKLLPSNSLFPTQPNRLAAQGVLARIYLTMRDYNNAFLYADSVLHQYNSLQDYNVLIPWQTIPAFNPEVIFLERSQGGTLVSNVIAIVDSTLYASYNSNDLRKIIFFKPDGNIQRWHGSYAATPGWSYDGWIFNGIASDEMYLIRAECKARQFDQQGAMDDLNTLMIKRWKNNGSWVPFSSANAQDALTKVLAERRKELCFRGLRWSDLRRLNLEGGNISLKRIIAGTEYRLPANDLRWVMLIPTDVINRSGIQQNPR